MQRPQRWVVDCAATALDQWERDDGDGDADHQRRFDEGLPATRDEQSVGLWLIVQAGVAILVNHLLITIW